MFSLYGGVSEAASARIVNASKKFKGLDGVFFGKQGFFSMGFFSQTDHSRDSRGRKGTIFNPLYHIHLLATFRYQFTIYMLDDYCVAPLVINRLPLDEIYHLGELPFD